MTYQTLSELILLILLAVSSGRIFFIKNARLDPLSAVPLVTLVFSVLLFFAFGISIFEVIIFLLSLFVTIWNVRALLRFKAKLVVDHYGLSFVLISILNLILIITTGIFVWIYRPAKIDLKKFNVEVSVKNYSGTLDGGLTEYANPLRLKSATVKKYVSKDEDDTEPKKILAFIPSESSRVDFYEPFFVKLAHDGFTVYAATFSTRDLHYFNSIFDMEPLRSSLFIKHRYLDHDAYEKALENQTENLAREFIAFLKIIPSEPGDSIFLSGDGVPQASFAAAGKNRNVRGSFDLSKITTYSTPGYGPVESTYPVLAKLLGFERDDGFYMASHIAGSLEKYVQETLTPPPPPKIEERPSVEEINSSLSDTEPEATENQ